MPGHHSTMANLGERVLQCLVSDCFTERPVFQSQIALPRDQFSSLRLLYRETSSLVSDCFYRETSFLVSDCFIERPVFQSQFPLVRGQFYFVMKQYLNNQRLADMTGSRLLDSSTSLLLLLFLLLCLLLLCLLLAIIFIGPASGGLLVTNKVGMMTASQGDVILVNLEIKQIERERCVSYWLCNVNSRSSMTNLRIGTMQG